MAKIICTRLTGSGKFRRLAGRSGQLHGLRSGLVVLKHKESIGLHTTAHREEAIIILEGKARIFYGSKKITAGKNTFIYIPRNAPHNIENISRGLLRYIYVTVS